MIFDQIILNKRREIAALQSQQAGNNLKQLANAQPPPRDFLQALRAGKFALIAEIKRASPSAGVISADLDPAALAKTYEASGATAISVLTDQKYFQGKLEDIQAAKEGTMLPILRKDFILDEVQVYESRLAGADAILLIVRILADQHLNRLLSLTEELGLVALVETHNAEEVDRALNTRAKIIGINNRDLDSLAIDLQTTIDLMEKFPQLKERTVISESGIAGKKDAERLRQAGVKGILVGETILKSHNPREKICELLSLG